ncbi:hypothetical protein [Lactobacillus taiwanensis]|uniref:hypothetical protein n=1 Tax=Lactobacillus taiwanensis TaxID=508451 RepID=UPI001AEBB833|nr:hypothetical protein [Lactobacillus taiwanensis]QTQ40862.1 hypothetical protein H1A07_09290 [Lactobacillus taiwanensis]
MADQNIEALMQMAKTREEEQKVQENERKIPFFLDCAKRVPVEDQEFVAKLKRESNVGNLDTEALVWAVGDEVSEFEIRKGYRTPVLKMHLEETNTPVYIFANEAGEGYANLDTFIDHRIKIAISTLLDAETIDDEGNAEYIALGSIRQAEFAYGYAWYQEMTDNPEKFKDEIRMGEITQVIDTPNFRFVNFTYQGVQLGMLAKNFYYQSFMHPLSEVAYIGMKFPFKITDIIKSTYEESPSVKRDMKNNRPVPKGIRFQVMTTRLPLLDSPDDEVRSLYDRHADFKAHIVRCHPVEGILVEIAPGWWVKGVLSTNSQYQPTIADARQNTPVIVRLDSIDEENHRGRAFIVRFPHGVARTLDPHNQ